MTTVAFVRRFLADYARNGANLLLLAIVPVVFVDAMAGGGHDGHDATGGGAVDVPARATVTVRYTMPATPPTFACHVSKHDEAGMTGTVTY